MNKNAPGDWIRQNRCNYLFCYLHLPFRSPVIAYRPHHRAFQFSFLLVLIVVAVYNASREVHHSDISLVLPLHCIVSPVKTCLFIASLIVIRESRSPKFQNLWIPSSSFFLFFFKFHYTQDRSFFVSHGNIDHGHGIDDYADCSGRRR
ncbi:hypothetical protein F4803DRAFT_253257 [Xylaria telfairii]|nr:hypothetical protein F4803DRAFT_253257 [Xylaria telfairii]